MSTKTEIVCADDINEVLNEEYSNMIFDKKSARLFINCSPNNKEVWFSVFSRAKHTEEKFDLLSDAVVSYNLL